jgi:FYVE zinc finger/Lipase (class 3)
VAALLTYLLKPTIPSIKCVVYGAPCCMTAELADELKEYVLTVVLHDDVISRLTPLSIRALLKELMAFRGTVFYNGSVYQHLHSDWNDIIERAGTLWSPRWREVHPKESFLPTHNPCETSIDTSNIIGHNSRENITGISTTSLGSDEEDGELVEEDNMIEYWLPGRIIHIYPHRGQYKAMIVHRSFQTLRQIEVQSNIFQDHRCEYIANALHEVAAVRHALRSPPPHQPFDAVTVCQCCNNPFTWHATFRSKSQEYREKHNCKACGLLVCGPCSQGKYPISKYGLIFPCRVCDACVCKGEFALPF